MTIADAIPPLPAEDHVCAACAMAYQVITPEQALELVAGHPAEVAALVIQTGGPLVRQRPEVGTWSITEYACHLRDVYATGTIRLHRIRTEQLPVLEPMLNDLRARRFRYNSLPIPAILDEMAANAAGFSDEAARFSAEDWDRMGIRMPGETRTARWAARQVLHEGSHHLLDIRRIGQFLLAGQSRISDTVDRVPLQLLVLRHGHAENEPPSTGGGDIARQLRPKGIRLVDALAPKVQALDPDLVLSSPAQRTRETVEHLDLSAPVDYLEPLYAADADELLDAVRELSARDVPPDTVLLVGHNPGVHQLVLELTGGEQLPGFPPSALAVLSLDVDHWWQADTGAGRLTALHLPDDPRS